MDLKSKLHTLAILLATAILAPILLGAGSSNEIAYGQAAVSPADQSRPADMSVLSSELGAMWSDVTSTIADAQWTLTGLQGYLGELMSKKQLPDANRQQMDDMIGKANMHTSQWDNKKQDLTNRLASVQSRIDYSSMSTDDAAMVRANMNGLRSLIDKGDIVISQMKSTMDMINKYK